ncbi:MAG TPA: serpin family protein [Ilumatobacteraceae bacterium]|nr:serpin family protein [Ilumatobacteraceae bacterium]
MNTTDRTVLTRRAVLAMLAAPAFAHIVASCSSSDTRSGTTTTPTGSDVAKSNLQRVNVPVDRADIAAQAINDFSDEMIRGLVANDPNGNVVFSPASVALALSMVAVGASGVTANEIYAALQVDDPTTIDQAMNALSAHLDTIDQTEGRGDEQREVHLNIANSLWGQRGLAFEAPFLDVLAEQYGAQMNLVDYRSNAALARNAINSWVDDATSKRIPELLGADDVDADTRLVLVNAIYLLATWERAFKKEATSKEPFTTVSGKTATVEMMNAELYCDYAKGDGWQLIELPYSFRGLSFTAVLPDSPSAALIGIGDVITTGDAMTTIESRKVRLGLPKFDFETRAQLSELLEGLGIKTAFTDGADFSKITKQEPLVISKVIHQANITVDERGTEAAAATAVVMETTSAPAPEDPIELTFNRPFQFWIRDTTTGAVIFAGRVTDPSATRS